jgi:hypothetical protein
MASKGRDEIAVSQEMLAMMLKNTFRRGLAEALGGRLIDVSSKLGLSPLLFAWVRFHTEQDYTGLEEKDHSTHLVQFICANQLAFDSCAQ